MQQSPGAYASGDFVVFRTSPIPLLERTGNGPCHSGRLFARLLFGFLAVDLILQRLRHIQDFFGRVQSADLAY